MSESREIRALRTQAWERAKGELRAMLCTYYSHGEMGEKIESNFEQMNDEINSFVTQVEDCGWQE